MKVVMSSSFSSHEFGNFWEALLVKVVMSSRFSSHEFCESLLVKVVMSYRFCSHGFCEALERVKDVISSRFSSWIL